MKITTKAIISYKLTSNLSVSINLKSRKSKKEEEFPADSVGISGT
jgi:hypothetical protein